MTIKKIFLSIIIAIFFLTIGCAKTQTTDDDPTPEPEPEPKEEIVLEKSNYTIMTGTTVETTVYVFKSNVSGPTVFITGGTHGDELAGWHAALKLLERDDYRGTVIIIPRLNRLACELEQRYPGTVDGVKYTDLNRAFPGDENGTITQQLAYAIQEEILKYDPKYVIDLHESRGSYTGGQRLGDQLLWGNAKTALMLEDVLEIYNTKYLEEGDAPFMLDGPGVEHSLNYWVGTVLGKYEFTVETSRLLALDKRISQQLNIINSFFEYIWNK